MRRSKTYRKSFMINNIYRFTNTIGSIACLKCPRGFRPDKKQTYCKVCDKNDNDKHH